MEIKLNDLAVLIAGELVGGQGETIKGIASVEEAQAGDIVFVDNTKSLKKAEESLATAIIVPLDVKQSTKPLIRVRYPRLAFAKVLEFFAPKKAIPKGIHRTAIIGENFEMGKEVSIQAHCFIGDNVVLGNRVVIYPTVYIGDGVKIGDDTLIYPHVTIYDRVNIGRRVIIHSGAVLGSDGFGYERINDKSYKIPQIGTVNVEDDVEIGANVTIDRATMGATVVGRGTKIDNLVQIAHNVIIGEDSIIVAQTGISGSVKIGERVILAGQVGVADHVEIGSDSRVAAQGGVIGDIAPGSFVSGYPARPHMEQMRLLASLCKLPELIKTVQEMQKQIKKG